MPAFGILSGKVVRKRPDLEAILARRGGPEPFFVKPLENVQGDERDTIFLSIGYGKDNTGVLTHNFGPINIAGGEKRLNVAITRARWELVVVSSILSDDIDETRITSHGPKLLKQYLAFARDGRLPAENVKVGRESESPFEQSVWEALHNRGISADRQVGASRYRIDLAIKDPERPGRYLLGVECDGATYHRSIVARDRDRLRQQVLEGLGWRIHRIWSTDWIRDQRGAFQRLLQRIEELRGCREPDRQVTVDGSQPTEEDEGAEPPDIFCDTPADHYAGMEDVGTFYETPPSHRQKGDFYDDDSDILRDVIRVVEYEGPVHEEVVILRVARMYNLKKTGKKINHRIRTQIKTGVGNGTIRRHGKFLWRYGVTRVLARRPAPGVDLRQIEYVPPEEIGAAAKLVVALTKGITETDLIAEIPRVLGYKKKSDNIHRNIALIVRGLLRDNVLILRRDHICLP